MLPHIKGEKSLFSHAQHIFMCRSNEVSLFTNVLPKFSFSSKKKNLPNLKSCVFSLRH